MPSSFSSSSNILLASCVNVLVLYSIEAARVGDIGVSTPARNQIFPALLAFGDSLLDTGNNNGLLTVIKCNLPPYGRDFPGQKATGRWGNGRVLSDLVAEGLGIKSLVPAFLDPNLPTEELATGVSFASGGSGVNPLTARIQNVISILEQFNNFKNYLARLEGAVGAENAKATISNGLFLVSSGNNDIAITYYLMLKKLQVDVNAYMTKLVDLISNFIQQMHGLGARKFVFLSTLPLGCLPIARTVEGGLQRICVEPLNEAAVMFNSKLEAQLSNLNNNLPGVKIVFIDIYNPSLEVIQNHEKYGFVDPGIGCCGTGTTEIAMACNIIYPLICPNVNSRLFFDAAHPSERAYKIIAPGVVNQILQQFSA